MRLPRIIYAALIVALIAVIAGCATVSPVAPSDAIQSLEKGNRLAVEAQQTKGEANQMETFKDAIAAYDKAAKVEIGSGKTALIAVQALLAKGKIQAGVPIDDIPTGKLKKVYHTKVQNDSAARETFRQLLQKVDRRNVLQPNMRPAQAREALDRVRKSLVVNYGEPEGSELSKIVSQAYTYREELGIRIDSANKGKVLYKFMDVLVAVTGRVPAFSYWFAIILLTVIVKILITPLTKAQFKSMREMQKLQPLIKGIQEKYKGDQREIGAKTMELYKEHGINPLAGCLPILIQMPILILVYTAIRYYEIQFANGTFLWIGWEPFVHKFSIPLGSRPVWVTAANLAQPDLILLILYTISMIVSQKLSAVDPTQAEQQKMMAIMMPLMFFFLIGYLPSAFVLYWFTFNLLQTWQQYHIIHGTPPAEPAIPSAPTAAPADRVRRPSGRRRRRR